MKVLKTATGATVNDVVMALCAGALRTWLDEKGELPDVPLVSMVPVSIRTGEEEDPWTNRVSAIFTDIPTNEADPLARLQRMHEAMAKGKEQFEMMPADLLSELSQAAPPALAIRASRIASRMRLGGRLSLPFNLVISNVPGPRQPLYLDQAPLVHYYPVSTLVEGQGLNITVQSYLNTLDFGLVGCSDLVPDLERLADLVVEELGTLSAAVASAAAASASSLSLRSLAAVRCAADEASDASTEAASAATRAELASTSLARAAVASFEAARAASWATDRAASATTSARRASAFSRAYSSRRKATASDSSLTARASSENPLASACA